MLRSILACGLLLAWTALAAAEEGEGAKEKGQKTNPANHILATLGKAVTFDKGVDPNTPLKDALEFITSRYEILFLVNNEAFKADAQVQEIETQPVRLPVIPSMRLATVLRVLLRQVNATYQVHDDYVEIVPLPMVVGPDGTPLVDRSALPLVYAIFEKRPLDEALRELADQADISVVLDANRAAEKAKAPVTATFKNVSVDTAVRLLADMTGLKMVRVENVLYVTTPEGASEVEQAKPEGKPKKKVPPAPGGSEPRPPAKN
jgi:hypothetical protein